MFERIPGKKVAFPEYGSTSGATGARTAEIYRARLASTSPTLGFTMDLAMEIAHFSLN